MNMPDFHDGSFNGLVIGPDSTVRLFLQTADGDSYILTLGGVKRLKVSELRQGNIVFDLTFRPCVEITMADMEQLHLADPNSSNAEALLASTRRLGLQILELNSSYGAEGLFLFKDLRVTVERNSAGK